ncbi:hypothetical protein KDD17_00920 [Sulfitobacter albidus]|uniref:DUF4169 family protein n=1 Tax=Sulfitobacter albidus TaxID=2829501 RepID=A0A975JDV1_9RHOB|nr:hypothetical protein [Sulfitobacter albidus]QUJ76664.1 hypothetical protein KDD17_00920 [Sulfitobacter albidus]
MTQKDTGESANTRSKQSAAAEREARLKQALKANMGRRKAQARAREAQGDTGTVQQAPKKED